MMDDNFSTMGSVHYPPSSGPPSGDGPESLMPVDYSPNGSTGHPIEILDLPDTEKYKCGFCNNLMREPAQSDCGHRFCKTCFSAVPPGTKCNPCSVEDEEDFTLSPENMIPDPAFKRELMRAPARCINPGCEWKGKIKEWVTTHKENCKFITIKCICGEMVPKHDFEEHKKSSCRHREIECSYCDEGVMFKDMAAHLNTCPDYPVTCTQGCEKKVKRSELQGHIDNTCDMRPCEFGCVVTGPNHQQEAVVEHTNNLLRRLDTLKVSTEAQENTESPSSQQLTSRIDAAEKKVLELNNKLKSGAHQSTESFRNPFTGTRSIQHPEIRGTPVAAAAGPGPVSANAFVAAAGPHVPHQEPSLSVQAPDIGTMTKKQVFLDDIGSVLSRQVNKLEKNQEDLKHQTVLAGDIMDQVKGKINAIERSMALKDIGLAEQKQRIEELETTSHDGTLLWVIDNVSKRRQDAIDGQAQSLYSSTFYTSMYGYKLRARIYLNGDGMGRGTHISMFFVLLKGQYDAILKWPFKQKVTFYLMDQNKRDDIVDAFRPDPGSSSFKRPQSAMNIASGVPLFCPLSRLEDRRFAYVKDDTMFIKIAVDTSGL